MSALATDQSQLFTDRHNARIAAFVAQAQSRFEQLTPVQQQLVQKLTDDRTDARTHQWVIDKIRVQAINKVEGKTLAQHIVRAELVREGEVLSTEVQAEISVAEAAIDDTYEERQNELERISESHGSEFRYLDSLHAEVNDIDDYGHYEEYRLSSAQKRIDRLSAPQQEALLKVFEAAESAGSMATTSFDLFLDLTMTVDEQRLAGLLPGEPAEIEELDDGGLEL